MLHHKMVCQRVVGTDDIEYKDVKVDGSLKVTLVTGRNSKFRHITSIYVIMILLLLFSHGIIK